MHEYKMIQKALYVLQASEDTPKEVKKMIANTNKTYTPYRKHIIVTAVMAAILALSLTAYAYGNVILAQIASWNGNSLIERYVDENGNLTHGVSYGAGDIKLPTELRDGRLYFIVNDVDIDITDIVISGQPFNWDYTDSDGNIHYFIVGGEIDNIGFAEYIKDADNDWLGGYSHNIITPDMETPEDHPMWYQVGRENIDCPW